MPTILEKQAQLNQLRGFRASLEWQLIDIESQIADVDSTLARLRREGLEGWPDWEAAEAQKTSLEGQLASSRSNDASMLNQIESLKQEIVEEVSDGDLLTLISPEIPLMLLPVRLETRFQMDGMGDRFLLVRVIPDAIHVDNFEKNLTNDEVTCVEAAWRRVYFDDPPSPALRRSIWDAVITQMSPQRAAFLLNSHNPMTVLQPPDVTPDTLVFPPVLRRPQGWIRAPRCRTMPDRWTFVVVNGETLDVFHGALIPETLALGPDPKAVPTGGEESVPVDPAMKWMVDFDEAVAVGMAIRIPLDEDVFTNGIDQLLVHGVKATARSEDGHNIVEHLFDAHQHANALALVSAWTPTNNTDATTSGYGSRTGSDPYDINFRLISQQDWDRSDGAALAAVLGANPDRFRKVEGGLNFAEEDALAMNTALWEATWGYFLDQMMAQSFTHDQIRYVREHFVNYVRARGPLPTLRVGRQPYGILPATTLKGWVEPLHTGHLTWKPHAEHLVEFLEAMENVYSSSLENVPRVGRDETSNSDELVQILGMQPTTVTLQGRSVYGDDLIDSFWSCFPGFPIGGNHSEARDLWWEVHQEMVGDSVTDDGLLAFALNPRLSYCSFSDTPFDITHSWVQAESTDEAVALVPNYIEALYDINFATESTALSDAYPDDVDAQPILYKLLRHSYLLEYSGAAQRKLIQLGRNAAHDFLERELVGMGDSTNLTFSETLSQTFEHNGHTIDLKTYCSTQWAAGNDEILTPLMEFYQSLDHLKALSVQTLEQLTKETLDLCAHRLDAWVTSFATERLKQLVALNPQEIVIGGFGWVEKLKRTPQTAVSETVEGETDEALPEETQSALYEAPTNDGYLHAPSLNQASTASVLLSGYLANQSEDVAAIDLSSRRARTALTLLDGVRSGQSLEALLGYRFERWLHECPSPELDQHIEPLRKLAPLDTVDEMYPTDTVVTPNCVVDGLQLIDLFADAESVLNEYLDELDSGEKEALETLLQRLSLDLDAVDDGITAESVHQMVQGNMLRTGATLEGVASGEAPPPELSVLDTPRTALVHTHRVLVMFTETIPLHSSWEHLHRDSSPVDSLDPDFVGQVEPRLNAWLGELLGLSTQIRCDGLFRLVGGGTVPVTISMRDLHLSPLNLLYLVGDETSFPLDLERLIQWTMWSVRNAALVPESATLEISLDRNAGWPPDEISMRETVEIIRTFRRLILQARPLEARDLGLPEQAQAELSDISELMDRAEYLVSNLAELQWELSNALANPPSSTAATEYLRDRLFEALLFMVPGSAPTVPFGNTPDSAALLGEQVAKVLKIVDTRLQKLEGVPLLNPVERIRTALGGQFKILPRFTPGNSDELAQAMSSNGALTEQDRSLIPEWLMRVGRVHANTATLYDGFSFLESYTNDPFRQCRVLQLPWLGDDDIWIEKQLTATNNDQSRVSIVAYIPGTSPIPPGTSPVSGLMIDEWNEEVPATTETTGVAFHYNRPAAEAPQAILLAVAPSRGAATWTSATLLDVVRDTLELAKYRTVDPEALVQVGHYLPALYLAGNLDSDTVATDVTTTA